MKNYCIVHTLSVLLLQLIVFSVSAKDFYWIGGSGNFNDIQHWSDQPGGKVNPDALLPDKDDNVFFDQYSFPNPGAEVVITNVARCANMHWGNVQNMPTLKTDDNPAHYLVIYGGATFNNNMILDLERPLYFRANTPGNVIDFGGNVFDGDFYFENNGGWRITSDLNLLGNDIYFNQGTLSVEAGLTCGRIVSENPVSRELYLNSSVINLQESNAPVLSVQTENLNLYPGSSKIVVGANNSKIETSGSKRIDFYDVEFTGNSCAIETNGLLATFNIVDFKQDGSLSGDNEMQELIFAEGSNYLIYSGGLQKVLGQLTAIGQCEAFIEINGESTGGTISAHHVHLDYLKVRDIAASGGAVLFSATNSYDLGGNSNWNFVAPAADDYTWAGAVDNNWGTPGNWDKNCVPSRNNNVIIPGTSSVNIDVPAECKSLDISDNSTLSGSETLMVFGSLNAGSSTWNFTGQTLFNGNSNNTISVNSAFRGFVSIQGSGEWTLAGDLTVDEVLDLTSGTLNLGGHQITCNRFISSGTLNRVLNMGNSGITITEGVLKAWDVEGSNITIDETNSQITLAQAGAEFYNNTSGGIRYGTVRFNPLDDQVFLTNSGSSEPVFGKLSFNSNARIEGGHQFEKIIFNQGREYLFQAGSEQKILTVDGIEAVGTCSEYISLKGDEGIAFFNCSELSSNIVRVRIENVNVKGGLIDSGGELEAGESIGVAGYDGWSFPNDLIGTIIYWTGQVDDDWFTAQNWSTGCIPTRKDDVVFDEAFVTGSTNVDVSDIGNLAECKDMTWTNAALLSFSGNQPVCIFGSLDLSGMVLDNFNYQGDFYLKSENSEDVNTSPVELIGDIIFEGNLQDDGSWLAGTWDLQGNLHTDGRIVLRNGTLQSNDHEIEASTFFSNYSVNNIRSLNLGASVARLERMEISPESFTFNAGTSEIIFTNGGELVVSAGADLVTFNNVSFEDSDGNAYVDIFADNVVFNSMIFNGNTFFRRTNTTKVGFTAESIQLAVGKTYEFESTQTYVFGDVIANGACEGTIDISGSGADAAIFEAKAGVADISVSSVNILNVHAQPEGVFEATSSISLGNTDGWTFVDEPAGNNLYWVGGTGSWDDPNHWSTSSGGVPNGCVPTAKDNVFFDDGSFTDTEQIVYTGAGDIRCRTMDWTGSEAARPHFEMGGTDITGVYIYGSLILNPAVEIDLSPMVNFYFRAISAEAINTFGYVLPNIVEFDGANGEWTLLNDLTTEGDCFIRYGKLIANGNDFECKSISSTDPTEGINSRGLDIRNSNVTITGKEDLLERSIYFNLSDAFFDQGFEFLSDNSTITFTGEAEVFIVGTSSHAISFNKLIFESDGELDSGFSGINPYVNHLHFLGNGAVNGKNHFGTVELERGFEFTFQDGKTYEMGHLLARGSCFAPIYIHSSDDGDQTTILAANDVLGNFLELKDIHADASNGASYNASNSFIISNVTGWDADGAIAPIALYWVGKGTDDSWHNHENWSTTEDGSEEGCVPTLNDDVYFTSASFLGSKLVEINTGAACHSITWHDDVDPGADFKVGAKLQIGGFMDLTENMSINMQGSLEFIGDGKAGDKLVDFADKSLDGDITFNGDGQSWIWGSGMVTSGDLYLESGSVSTGGYDFTINRFSSLSLGDFYAAREFDMSGSLATLTSNAVTGWNMKVNTDGGLDFLSNNSKITFVNGGGIYCETDTDVTFGFVDFMDNGAININGNGEGIFGSVAFFEQGQIFGDNTFSNLEFTLGYENNTIESGKTITIENDLRMEGVRCSYIFLRAGTPGSKAYIHKPSGLFSKIYNASLTDIQGSSASGDDHPVHFKYDNNNSTGFFEQIDAGGEENPPSFEESFDQPREEWCSNIAVLDHVQHFPINSTTTFQWYYSVDGAVGTYAALDGETSTIIEVDQSGFYKVNVVYGLSNEIAPCIIESVIEVALGEISTVSLEITSNNVKCFGDTNGRIVAAVANVQYPDYQFFWEDEEGNDPGASTNMDTWTSTALGLEPGKYHIAVADGKNCGFDTIVNVFDAYELLIDEITPKDLTCFHQPEGEILISASGGTGNLSYYLDNELQPGAGITGLYSGDYSVYVEDENQCATDEEAALVNSNPQITTDWQSSGLLCYNDQDGEINPNVAGGVPSYNYSWTGPDGFTSSDVLLTGISGGTYRLTVTDSENCGLSEDYELYEPAQLTTNRLVIVPTSCNGENSGEIFVEATQGTPGYRYFLNSAEGPTGLFENLAPANYDLRIIDAHGCIFDSEINVTEPDEIGFLVEDIVLPSCKNTNDGLIRISPYGGNNAYTFSWSGPNDFRSYSQSIDGLFSGDYTLLIKDNKNCSSSDTVELTVGLSLQLGLVVEQHVSSPGANDGALAIETIHGTAPYVFTVTGPGYSLNRPDNFDDNSYLIENLTGGVYAVTATDASGCTTVKKSIIIEEPGRLFAFIEQEKPIGCAGGPDGELTAVAKGGDGNYSYSWSGPGGFSGTGQTITGLAAGTYNLTATSAGQSVVADFELLPADPLIVSVSDFKNVSCLQAADGEIELDVDAGNVDYTISWTNGSGFLSSAIKILDLEPETYTYTVTTEYDCSVSGSQIITEPSGLSLSVPTTDISQAGERDGTLSAILTGGTGPYTILVSGPNGYSYAEEHTVSGNISITGLEMGVYEVTGIDDNGCRIEDAKKVHEPEKLLLYVLNQTDATCPGSSDGSIEIGIEGFSAVENLSYSWTGDHYFSSSEKDISNLKAGRYDLTIYDSGGDPGYEEQTIIVTIDEPDLATVEYWKKDISCPGINDGYINIHPQGGTPGYTYLWTGVNSPNNEDQNNLPEGTYTVQVTDSKGCTSDVANIDIVEPRLITVNSNIKSPSCYGFENGWINLDISNGAEPYSVSWDNYGSVTQNIQELERGEYEFTVTDDNGCMMSDVITLNEPDSLIAEIYDFSDVLCHGEATGRAFVDIQGGTPDYDIEWSDGQSNQEASGLKHGSYDVKVTDVQGCTDVSNVEIFVPEPLVLEVEVIRPTTVGSNDGAISLEVTGGVPTYSFNWDSVASFDFELEELERGTYHATITDRNNCTTDSLIVLEYLFERRVRIPKAFTPNNDGYNDYWDIERIEFVQDLKIVIYDRWGKTIYKFYGTGNEYKGNPWTGAEENSPLPIGSYYYAVEVDNEKPIMGTVTILR